jgi:DNA-binding transcriptional ArsR family regulator
MRPEKQQSAVHLCQVLLDENRLKILGFLANQPAGVSELATALNLAETAVSRQLGKLRAAGLVSAGRTDERTVYQLDLDSLHARKEELFAREPGTDRAEPETPAGKVLDAFVDGERLVDIPVKHSKRLVVLEWLAGKFETGVEYPERAVNELIKRHHPDFASLRRFLVDAGLMERSAGIYRRTAGAA